MRKIKLIKKIIFKKRYKLIFKIDVSKTNSL